MSRHPEPSGDWRSRPLPTDDDLTYGDLVDRLTEAGLVGLGGAAFRTAVKVRAAIENGAAVIVNACDGEVGSAKDHYVVQHHLTELVQAAEIIGGDRVVYAAHRGSQTAAALRSARLKVMDVPTRYVSSEGTSLVNLAHGGLARPLVKHVPSVHGSRAVGRSLPPTVVLNAETLWRMEQIRRFGPTWFRLHGTPQEPGPRLVTVNDATQQVVLESQAGEPLSSLLERGGISDPTYVLVGGLSGTWLTGEEALATRWSSEELRPFGGKTGAGMLLAIREGECPLVPVAAHIQYLSGESSGQCGPCMFGVPAVAEDLLAVIGGRAGSGAQSRLRRRARLLTGRGACQFPDGVASYVLSALRVLGEHLDEHAKQPPDLKESYEQLTDGVAAGRRSRTSDETRNTPARHRSNALRRSRHLRNGSSR